MNTLDFKPKMVSALKNYNKQTFMADLMAGVIVGIVALPLAIAFGIASGVSPEKGIITAIVAGLFISLFGGSKVQIGGPTGAFIVIVYGIIQQYGIQGLTIATLMAGVFLILLGVLRLGTIIKYIPYPIVVGFTSGIAVTIFTTQVKDLLGMTIDGPLPSDFMEKWGAYIYNIGNIDPWSALVGIISVAIIASWPMMVRKFHLSPLKALPGSLAAIVLMTIAALLLKQYAGITTIETIGDRFSINSTLPGAVVPELSWETIKGLVGSCHRRHCPHHDQYQQRRSHPRCRHCACGRAVAHLPVPHAPGSVHPHGLSGWCTRCRLLRHEWLALVPGHAAQSQERCHRTLVNLLPHHHLRPHRRHRVRTHLRLSALHAPYG